MSPFLSWMWRQEKGISNILRFPFTVLSWLYGAVVRVRVLCYETGWMTSKKVDARVVSIGNLTTGGTGKTPLVIYLAEQWLKKSAKVGIVSRGYRRSNEKQVLIVSEGASPLAGPEVVGDEHYLMAERLKGVPIVVSADRIEGCQTLIDRFGVEVILLDDAFQHLKIHRDTNILIIDALNPFGNGYLLPRGCLREPLSAINRADYVVFSRINRDIVPDELMEKIRPFQIETLHSRFESSALIGLKSGTARPLSDLSGMLVVPFCGIGNPAAFLSQLKDLGAKIERSFIFEDHHVYQEKELLEMTSEAKNQGAQMMVTTEKDAVKIKAVAPAEVFVLRINLVFKLENELLLSTLFER